MNIADIAARRYTAKHYDATKKIPPVHMEQLLRVLRNSPSSVNSQPWHFVIVNSEQAKKRILPAITDFNLPRITDASHIVVFCVKESLDEQHLKNLLAQEEHDGRFPSPDIKVAQDKGRHFFVNLNSATPESQFAWASKQTYIALGQLLLAAATLGIDSTPIEGFDANKMDEILGLKAQGLKSIVVAALGYHHPNDVNAIRPKSRLARDQIFTFL